MNSPIDIVPGRGLDTPNYLTERGANRLRSRVEVYWKARGYTGIKTHLEEQKVEGLDGSPARLLFLVRSNIGPLGFPPREAAAQ